MSFYIKNVVRKQCKSLSNIAGGKGYSYSGLVRAIKIQNIYMLHLLTHTIRTEPTGMKAEY
jgi:hypothetical protein